ncbi:MAG: thiosulfate oxidation carrier protein SoxY [Sneathiella sp.]
MTELTRRHLLGLGAGAMVISTLSIPFSALADTSKAKEAIMAFTGGKTPKEGLVTVDMPEIAENGNTVPVGVSVDSPMTKDNYVKSILVLADGNPTPGVATFHFSPASGAAEASSRMRLAKTQNVIAVAAMSDGSFHSAQTTVKVTIGGCGG